MPVRDGMEVRNILKEMKHNHKEVKISFWASHVTTIVSVTLVLLLGGIIAVIWTGARNESRRLREQLELTVILADSVSDAQGMQLAREIGEKPYAATVRFTGRDEAMRIWSEETGENLEELFGVNPLSPEVTFGVRADYTSKENIGVIRRSLEKVRGVESVASPDDETVDAMNDNIARLTVVLSIVAAIMLVISFVLITNTVRLSIYSRRFTIHTMQLVGATDGFIRRPIVTANTLCGLLSGLIASGILALCIWGASQSGLADIFRFFPWSCFAIVAAGMTLAGAAVCALASWAAATAYLHRDYDELFR